MVIDFHTHILPGMDDGSKSVEESLSMLREESKQGVDLVVMTPHFYAAQNDVPTFLSRRAQAWDRLKDHLTQNMPQIRLGAEVQYFEGICHVESISDLRMEGSSLLLLEMPFTGWSERMIRDVLELNEQQDQQVVLAHIDRYLKFQNRDVWERLYAEHVLMQVNSSFFLKWETRLKAKSMLRHGEIHMVGSDCHNMKTRVPNLGKVYQIMGKHADSLVNTL